jgi:archaemetzincin
LEEGNCGRSVSRIQLLPLGSVAPEVLSGLASGIAAEFRLRCDVLPADPDPAFAYNITRQQYSSTEILAAFSKRFSGADGRYLAVTSVDLYIPILTFVFGEAQLAGNCAVISAHRLRQEFYGLPADDHIYQHRLLKESIHELGHTFAIPHCEDYECVMAPSHAVEWIDLKTPKFCATCRANLTVKV